MSPLLDTTDSAVDSGIPVKYLAEYTRCRARTLQRRHASPDPGSAQNAAEKQGVAAPQPLTTGATA
eukprot:5729836-Alexandrium_andersonii.AAC.1